MQMLIVSFFQLSFLHGKWVREPNTPKHFVAFVMTLTFVYLVPE